MLNISKIINIADVDKNIDIIRNMEFDSDDINKVYELANMEDVDIYELMTFTMLNNDYGFNINEFQKFKRNIESKDVNTFNELNKLYKGVFEDLRYFPIPKSTNYKTKFVAFENSFMQERSFGGDRVHEGTDILPGDNIEGKYPVISMCDGVVEQVGWLKLGGYRIGIRSVNGLYMYYAHLDSYIKDFKPGDLVKAGEMLGYMGSTGYSEVEGTKGNFLVHLHLGIYYDFYDNEISLNPYYILLHLKNNLLYYNY